MKKYILRSVAAAILAVIMLLSIVPVGALVTTTDSSQDFVSFALTQEGKTGNDYAASDGISFDWCVWFTTYCASHVGLCGTPSDYTCNVFPPIESSTWSANNWAATGVTYQINWMTQNNKGTYYYFGSLDSRISSNSNIVYTDRCEYVPERGDLIYFDWEVDSKYNHVAIVYDYDASTETVSYIGGNQGTETQNWPDRCVSKRTLSKRSDTAVGFLKTIGSQGVITTQIANPSQVTTRRDGVWLWPLDRSYYNSFSDWAGCNSSPGSIGPCPFHGTSCSISCSAYHHTSDNLGHNGCDIAASSGANVYAAASGTAYRMSDSSRGNYIVIEHNINNTWSYYSYYQHLSSFSVNDGASVSTGTVIGKVGTTGASTGSHLHFGIVLGAPGLHGSAPNQLEGKGWILSEGYPSNGGGRIVTNPAMDSPAGIPSGLTSVRQHCGSVKYTFSVSEVSVGSTPQSYYLDLNGRLNGSSNDGLASYGTADLYINGSKVSNDINDYYTKWASGTTYEFKDIKPNTGYSYDGVYSGTRTGTINGTTNVVLAFSQNDFSTITESPERIPFNGHTYLYYSTPVTWYFAKEYCEYMGGHLATVTSAAENEFLKTLFSDTSVWLGATDYGTTNEWRWITGEAFNYTSWAGGEPSNDASANNDSEDYLHFFSTGNWNDNVGCKKYPFILEIEGLDHEHSLEHIAAKAETCTANGNIEYWHCSGCGKCYSDAAGNNEITLASTVIPAHGHSFVDEPFEATCISYAGTLRTCSECGYFYIQYPGEYTDWSTEYPSGINEALIQSRIEYRYRDYETTTSYNQSMSGWTLIGSEWQQSDSGTIDYSNSWPSSFSTSHSLYTTYHNTPKTASETATDKTVINSTTTLGYIYWHWCRGTYTDGPINRAVNHSQTSEFNTFHAFFSTVNPSTLTSGPDDSGDPVYQYPNANSCTDTYWYYSFPLLRQSWTSYRKLFTYGRWTDWSAWSTTPYTASSTRQVQTRTVYRYVTAVYGPHQWNEGVITTPCTHEHDGEMTYTCTLCGATRTEVIPSPDTYTVTYYVDGEQYAQQLYWADEAIVLPEYTAPEGYDFSGWALQNGDPVPEIMPAYDLDVYGTTIRNYITVTFTGAYIGTQEVPYGGDAVLPVLDAEGIHYTFTVNGEPWTGTGLTDDVTVEVGMDINVYTVTFIDPIDDLILDIQQVTHGSNASAPAAPEHYGYTFEGWDTVLFNVKSDLNVTAVYAPVSFTVIFMDGCDNVIDIQSVAYHTAANSPADPVREGYTFTGWDADFSNIEHDMVINATWSRNYYTVTFIGVYSATVIVEHGSNCELPVYDSTSIHYTFTVNGEPWDGKNITSDVTVTVGVAINGNYTVTFVDWDGTVLDEQTVYYGNPATAPDDPTRPGYTFIGWDVDFTCITGDLTVTAVYEQNAPSGMFGDVDCNGTVDFDDVTLLNAYLLNAAEISEQGLLNANVNGDNKVSSADVVALNKLILGNN